MDRPTAMHTQVDTQVGPGRHAHTGTQIQITQTEMETEQVSSLT